jgi:hypothetical protein
LQLSWGVSLLLARTRKENVMGTKQKSSKRKKVKVNKLKIEGQKVAELTDKQAKRIRGGVVPKDTNLLRIRSG